MRKKIMPFAVCCILLMVTSCATIFTGKKTKITFQSNVEGKVYQNLIEIGKTNESITIRKKDIVKLYTIKSPGCPDKQLELPIKATSIVLLNLLNLNIFANIDYMNGCHLKTDEVINITLDCNGKK